MDRVDEILGLLKPLLPLVEKIDREQAAIRADIDGLKSSQAALERRQAEIEQRQAALEQRQAALDGEQVRTAARLDRIEHAADIAELRGRVLEMSARLPTLIAVAEGSGLEPDTEQPESHIN